MYQSEVDAVGEQVLILLFDYKKECGRMSRFAASLSKCYSCTRQALGFSRWHWLIDHCVMPSIPRLG